MNTSIPIPRGLRLLATGVLLIVPIVCHVNADAVLDWNAALESTLIMPPVTPNERGPAVPARTYAILHAAMFDAVNGIERRYEPLHVTDAAPPGARAEAAAIHAAYTVLSALRPANQAVWDAQLAASLRTLPGGRGHSKSIARGRAWGETVANAILAWRTGDVGAPPPFAGITDVGYWKHPSNTSAGMAGYDQLATAPFLITDPLAFNPGPPYGYPNRADALTSATYAEDVNEALARGGAASSVRTADEEYEALFLNAADQASLNAVIRSIVPAKARLVDNARLFALINVAYFDTRVAIFRVKYIHQLWRPNQGINNADLDGNAATTKPATPWTSLRGTPPHPEYPSAHVSLFTALVHTAGRLIGDTHEVDIHAPGYASPITYPSLGSISDATIEARVNIGYHFRHTCEVSQVVGQAVADHLVGNFLQPLRGRDWRKGGH